MKQLNLFMDIQRALNYSFNSKSDGLHRANRSLPSLPALEIQLSFPYV